MKRILINVTEPLESRIAVISQPRYYRSQPGPGATYLEELYLERASQETLVGNIYRGRVVNIQPNLQAAFIDIGLGKNGFLPVSETITESHQKRKTDIRNILKLDNLVITQVTRDGIGDKGPSLTMDISLPGRYLILRPYPGGVGQISISQKISGTVERNRLKKLLQNLNPPPGFSFIIRTAGAAVGFQDLKNDLLFLTRLWRIVNQRLVNTTDTTGLVYQESDLIIRTLRDIFSPLIKEILIDSEPVFNKVKDFFNSTMPRYQNLVKLYRENQPIFDAFQIESQANQIYEREIKLKSGGSIVIESTEALAAIDVNSGRFRKNVPPEELSFRTNLEAAEEIVHQLKLRDLGGIVVIDFIEMKNKQHIQQVEKILGDGLKKDRSKTTVSKISRLGLMEIARQKIGPGKMLVPFVDCPACNGTGLVKSVETVGLEVLHRLKLYQQEPRRNQGKLTINVSEPVGNFLEQPKIKEILLDRSRNNRSEVTIKKHLHFNLEKIEIS